MIKSYEIDNVKCSGCANTLKKALEDKFTDIEINLEVMPRVITINIDGNEEEFKEILKKLGYPLISDNSSGFAKASMKAKSFVSCAVGKFS